LLHREIVLTLFFPQKVRLDEQRRNCVHAYEKGSASIIVPAHEPKPMEAKPSRWHRPLKMISSPSAKKLRISPFGIVIGRLPPAVNSSMLLNSSSRGPEIVPRRREKNFEVDVQSASRLIILIAQIFERLWLAMRAVHRSNPERRKRINGYHPWRD
jgi:hypothetical protein